MNKEIADKYKTNVLNKYQVYNSLYTSLPYEKMENIGTLIPFLYDKCKQGFDENKPPLEIIDDFFKNTLQLNSHKEKIELLFRIIQYVERQVVLCDSIEDAAFTKMYKKYEEGTLFHLHQLALVKDKIPEIQDKLKDFKVRIVFTAHPTQFYPNNVLRIIYALEEAIKADNLTEIDILLQQLGLTPFINTQQPSPLDEAMSIIYYMRHIYYDAIGLIQVNIKKLFFKDQEINPVIELGFWPGGDRDGNPFVTAAITKQVTMELRLSIMKCYYNDIKKLMRKATFKNVWSKLEDLKKSLYDNMFGLKKDLKSDAILKVLNEVKNVLITKYNNLCLEDVNLLIEKVKLFDVHFASLDIRQDSSIHNIIMNSITQQLKLTPYDNMMDDEKLNFLTQKNIDVDKLSFGDNAVINDTFENIKQLKEIQKTNGEKAIHRYIISNTTSLYNILEVFALFRFCNYNDKEITFDIVPLFETMEGLENCKLIMDTLYKLPFYKKHLAQRNQNQYIMLGFSDGTKDGGYLKANFKINVAKEILSAVANENNIRVVFFDGRGGPPARGGGKTHEFYAAQSDNIANHEIQLTIQGQTISSMYGSKPQAFFNFSQILTASLYKKLRVYTELDEADQKNLAELAELSFKKYESLKEHPKFVPYLEYRSTLKYYGKTNIGSRPTQRNKNQTMKFADLRAIPFVGSWSLLKQNVPGYFGLGSAIQIMIDNNKEQQLKNLYDKSLFFKALVQNSMMALSKSYFPLTSYMKEDKEFGEFWGILHNEYELSKNNLLKISGMTDLMEDAPLNKLSILQREKIILPLLAIQQYALQKIELNEDVEVYEKMVIRALFGNINASRNSA